MPREFTADIQTFFETGSTNFLKAVTFETVRKKRQKKVCIIIVCWTIKVLHIVACKLDDSILSLTFVLMSQ